MEPLNTQWLKCSVQNYDWGRIGQESQVARLFSLNSKSEIELNKPYAELWMGTHESGPSFIIRDQSDDPDSSSLPLKSWIYDNPNAVGDRVVEKWGNDLPFLFKVLSVAKALSIQAHPDKELAKVLHKSQPSIYKDSNHKPEMALALTEFEALCGFITTEELKGVLNSVPEIVALVGNVDANQVLITEELDGEEEAKSVLRSIFTKLMSANKEEVSEMVSQMKSRLNMESEARTLTEKEQLILRLEKQYPADIGVLAAFFLNYVKLNPGEALYLGANEPHAYIYGECIECMATSDNVVRAGLTPKFLDVQTLCSMLTYKQGFPEILRGTPLNPYTTRYTPPFDEFEVDRCILPLGESVVFSAIPGPSLFAVIAGKGTLRTGSTGKEDIVKEGGVFFVPARTQIIMTAASEGDTTKALELYRAGVNSRCFEK
eukprot:TRINITY_DN18259_c0_g1_i1.p1 TRINITY_DN18259_c0_g1~~TRINITY_DN18259_c0_g1_i1.p1  ORF type:complete len:431 (+),score=67.64 TRINITY_DN18259_c0_g1_i1:135-1427(+)